MLFISKNLVFSDFTWKKNDSLHGKKMIPENGRGEEPGVPHALLQCLRPKRGLWLKEMVTNVNTALKSSGPNIDPCGTPESISFHELYFLPILVLNRLFVK